MSGHRSYEYQSPEWYAEKDALAELTAYRYGLPGWPDIAAPDGATVRWCHQVASAQGYKLTRMVKPDHRGLPRYRLSMIEGKA